MKYIFVPRKFEQRAILFPTSITFDVSSIHLCAAVVRIRSGCRAKEVVKDRIKFISSDSVVELKGILQPQIIDLITH
jgi:hypothetical protein